MSIRALLSSRLAAMMTRAAFGIACLSLAACALQQPPATASGRTLFARGLHDIADLYLQPISSSRLARSGIAQLLRLDGKLAVTDTTRAPFGNVLSLSYNGQEVAFFAAPPDSDSGRWGDLVADLAAAAKRASPRIAAVPQETIDTAVFDGMTMPLDRFSHYSPPEIAREQRAARDGFGGIGVTLDTEDNLLRVTAVTPQGPAAAAGIRPEDQIIAIDGVATAGRSPPDIIHRLRGPIDSAIAITIRHPGTTPSELQLHRADVAARNVTMSRDGNIAVFRVASFNRSTARRVATGLAQAERPAGAPLAGIVLDLRGNPGGLLDQAVGLADLFIRNGPIVATVGRNPASRQYFAAVGDSMAPSLPLVVLINGGSASASEIVAAAFQDLRRAVVIGSSSYGKGTVQTVLRLPNDGELTVTWARLVTPTGYLLQTHGVVPTVCTADLPDDATGFDAGLQRIAAVAAAASGAGPAPPPRVALDEAAWSALRRACPPRHNAPSLDLQLAERLIADPALYSEALHALPAAATLADGESAVGAADRALTDVDHALSSHSH